MKIKGEINTNKIFSESLNPDNLIVEDGEGPSTDPSVIQITQNKMDSLKIFKSETVLLKGKKGKETVCICLPDFNGKLSDNKIRMGKCVRNNLDVAIGDIISIEKYQFIPLGNSVHILPFKDTIQGISGNLTNKCISFMDWAISILKKRD